MANAQSQQRFIAVAQAQAEFKQRTGMASVAARG